MSEPTRLALVGSACAMGQGIKETLAHAGFPGSALTLLDLEEQVGLLTEYGDEARVVVEAAAESVVGHRLVCFCGSRRVASELIPVVTRSGGTVIDTTGASWGDPDVVLVRQDGIEASLAHESPLLAIPHPATLLIAELANALPDGLGGGTATVLLPSTDLGEDGPDELAAQAAALLNFADMPVAILGRRLAFDAAATNEDENLPAFVVAQLASMQTLAPRIATARIGVFHGVSASIHLPASKPSELRTALRDARFQLDPARSDGAALDSPATLVAAGLTTSVSVHSDGRDGAWLWAVQDSYRITAGLVSALALALPDGGETTH